MSDEESEWDGERQLGMEDRFEVEMAITYGLDGINDDMQRQQD
jgi:hypothetical protein